MLQALFTFAQVRPTETWTVVSVIGAVLLFSAVVVALTAWIVRVVTRR